MNTGGGRKKPRSSIHVAFPEELNSIKGLRYQSALSLPPTSVARPFGLVQNTL